MDINGELMPNHYLMIVCWETFQLHRCPSEEFQQAKQLNAEMTQARKGRQAGNRPRLERGKPWENTGKGE